MSSPFQFHIRSNQRAIRIEDTAGDVDVEDTAGDFDVEDILGSFNNNLQALFSGFWDQCISILRNFLIFLKNTLLGMAGLEDGMAELEEGTEDGMAGLEEGTEEGMAELEEGTEEGMAELEKGIAGLEDEFSGFEDIPQNAAEIRFLEKLCWDKDIQVDSITNYEITRVNKVMELSANTQPKLGEVFYQTLVARYKRIRALRKKIRQAESLEKKSLEKDLSPEEMEKMSKLPIWRSELKMLLEPNKI